MMEEHANLANEVCTACQVGAPKVSKEESVSLLETLPEWTLLDESIPKLFRQFKFDNFVQAMAFANKAGELAESLGHHPKIVLEWGSVEVYWWTHKIAGLHRNDFISAAKTDALF